ncbi:hypothetical protein D5086_008299 [Populus alba]|uniref:Uncharacterized protein n=1 Tax=Populus alba TaxID=43335 RepID=A0ACC4CGD1_POPAL
MFQYCCFSINKNINTKAQFIAFDRPLAYEASQEQSHELLKCFDFLHEVLLKLLERNLEATYAYDISKLAAMIVMFWAAFLNKTINSGDLDATRHVLDTDARMKQALILHLAGIRGRGGGLTMASTREKPARLTLSKTLLSVEDSEVCELGNTMISRSWLSSSSLCSPENTRAAMGAGWLAADVSCPGCWPRLSLSVIIWVS